MEIEERSLRKNNILLVVIGIATLLVAIVSATFAYFSAIVTRTNEGTSVKIVAATIGISYNHGQEVVAEDLRPGDEIPDKVVTIQNTNTQYSAAYSLRWMAGLTNTFVNQTDLTYTVTCTGTSAESKTSTPLPASGPVNILTGVTLPANTTHECTFKFNYAKTALDQNADQGKSFIGNFEIVADQLP